jgi:hypothetical protein
MRVLSLPKIRLLTGTFVLVLGLVSSALARAVLSGTVRDASSKQPLAGATVFVVELQQGTTTDENGRYALTLPLGTYTLRVTRVGYYRAQRALRLLDDTLLDLELLPSVTELDELAVKGRRDDANVRSNDMGVVRLNVATLKKIPVVFGETDILRALLLQPGLSTVGEGAGGFNVRGGRVDQNLVLLDGAPLFSTSHLLGFFSNLNPDLVQDVTLYKGTMPARYGGRLSSALVMNTRSGSADRWNVSGGVGTISSRLVVDGPLVGNKLTLMAGGRLAYPNAIIKLFPDLFEGSRAAFGDLNGKLTYQPNDRHRVALSAYRSTDTFKFPADTTYGWTSGTATLRWNALLSRTLSTEVSLLQSTYGFTVDSPKPFYEFSLQSGIRQREASAGLTFQPHEARKLEAGAGYVHYRLQPGSLSPAAAGSSVRPLAIDTELGQELSAYFQEEWTLSPAFTLTAGLRYVRFHTLGPYTRHLYEPGVPSSPETLTDSVSYGRGERAQTYGGWEPRLALRVGLGTHQSLKFSYNRTRQFLHLISNTTAISPVDFWKLSDPFVPPQVADQYSAGFFKNWKDNRYEASLEAYYKDITNLVEYRNGAELLLNPYLETALLSAVGKAYGLEVAVAKVKGRLTGSANYTYARSLVRTPTAFASEAINRGRWYPSLFDRPHTANLTGSYLLGKGWTYSGTFTYTTGRTNTYPDGQYRVNGLPMIHYSLRNADRLPDYHRLDMAISHDSRRTRDQSRYSVWTFSLYNLYGRRNPYSIYFEQFRSYQLSVFGSVIPSLTWNFHY